MALFLLKANSAFSITTKFATLDTLVIEGSVTIDSDFFDQRVWGDTVSWKSEYRGESQATGSVTAFHDDAAAAVDLLADLEPSATGSVLTMTIATGRTIVCNAHLHNLVFGGSRQSNEGVKISFNFRSIGKPTTLAM